jgi:hypothetical protein
MVPGRYPSSRLYLKVTSSLIFKTQRIGDWILSPSSGKGLFRWAQSIEVLSILVLVQVSGDKDWFSRVCFT